MGALQGIDSDKVRLLLVRASQCFKDLPSFFLEEDPPSRTDPSPRLPHPSSPPPSLRAASRLTLVNKQSRHLLRDIAVHVIALSQANVRE